MLKKERQEAICRIVDERGTISCAQIIDELHVSAMTIRRDLSELDKAGRLKRIHGGARSLRAINRVLFDDDTEAHGAIFLGPGTWIAERAVSLCVPGQLIYTTSLPAFIALQESGFKSVTLIGGLLDARTQSFIGQFTLDSLAPLRFENCFVECECTPEGELVAFCPHLGQILETVWKHSRCHTVHTNESQGEKPVSYCFDHTTEQITAF